VWLGASTLPLPQPWRLLGMDPDRLGGATPQAQACQALPPRTHHSSRRRGLAPRSVLPHMLAVRSLPSPPPARRPLNRILVAQRISRPQMLVSLAVVPLHTAATYGLVHGAKLGYVGAALAVGAWGSSTARQGQRRHARCSRGLWPPLGPAVAVAAKRQHRPWPRSRPRLASCRPPPARPTCAPRPAPLAACQVGVSNGLTSALLAAYIAAAGLAPRVFGGGWARVFEVT
jgi:hypothetical protein